MKLNGIDVMPVVHETRDAQEIKKFMESVNEDVVEVSITPYAKEPNVVKYLVILFVKVV